MHELKRCCSLKGLSFVPQLESLFQFLGKNLLAVSRSFMHQSYKGFILVFFFLTAYHTPYADRIEARKWSKHISLSLHFI